MIRLSDTPLKGSYRQMIRNVNLYSLGLKCRRENPNRAERRSLALDGKPDNHSGQGKHVKQKV